MMKRILTLALAACMCASILSGCGNSGSSSAAAGSAAAGSETEQYATGSVDKLRVDYDTSYTPAKTDYKLYFNYKLIHAWYDAIEVGVKAAVADFKAKGVTIDYEWYAPTTADATDQVNTLEAAIGQGWDAMVIDVNQTSLVSPIVDEASKAGIPVVLFASVDIPDSSRVCFIGNTDNYADGAAIAEAVCQKMGQKGEIAFLSGTIGAESHEQRLKAFYDTVAKYPDMKVVADERDDDMVENAQSITESWLSTYPNLGGILCNNMSNPVGAAIAVSDAGKSGQIVIGGMDHDERALNYLKDGTIYVLAVQNCFDMGYIAVYQAIKAVDGVDLADSNVIGVGSTLVYQEDAQEYIDLLYNS